MAKWKLTTALPPATIADCARDYRDGTPDRETGAKKDRLARIKTTPRQQTGTRP